MLSILTPKRARARFFTRKKTMKPWKKSKSSRTRIQGSWGTLSVDVRSFKLGTCNFWIRGHTSELSYAEDAANFNALTTNYYMILLLFYILYMSVVYYLRYIYANIVLRAWNFPRFVTRLLSVRVVLCGVKMLSFCFEEARFDDVHVIFAFYFD